MWNNTSIGLLMLEVLALFLYLMGYFEVQPTFSNINEAQTSNQEPMKVILLLVDALRVDLFANQNFSFYEDMKKNQEEYQILYYGISSTPTATQLNLKSITTGNFPAFVDFGSNMAAQELKEDNIIYSMKRNNKKIALLGDDTWFHMFPKSFDYKFVSESFDVRDINSDDNIIINNIEKLIKEDEYDFIVGHLLGIDHSGHSFNDSNILIWRKQKQYSDLLYKIYKKMDNNTMLFVVGDHGMSQDGNHGGDSSHEVSSTIYGINKKYKFNKNIFNQVIRNKRYINQLVLDRNLYTRQVYSINLAPTISYLMGISMPFSNIGAILTEMINTKEQQENSCKENLIQIMNYLNKLVKSQGTLDIKLQKYEKMLSNTKLTCQDIQELILELQVEIKEKAKTHDYAFLYLGVTMMIILFAFHLIKIMEYLFDKHLSNQNPYLIYRIEFLIIVMPIAFIIYLLFSLYLSIKFISIYLIFAILKQIILPLTKIENLNLIVQKVMNPLPKYRQYFMIFTNIIVQKGIQELSLRRQYVYSSNIFGTILNIFIIILITNQKLIKYIWYVILALSLLILQEQYNIPPSSTQPQSAVIFSSINWIFQQYWIKYILPIVFLQIILYKLNFKIYFYILLGLAQFIYLFNNCQQFNHLLTEIFEDYLTILTIYLPMFLYICSIVLIFIFKDLSYFFLIILTVSGKQGIMIYCCLFYSIYYLTKFFLKIDKAWLPLIAGATIQLILNYSWFCLGHRMSFSNVKFQDALIGFENFDVIFTTTLLIISIFGLFAILDLIKKITLHILENDQDIDCKEAVYYFNNKIIDSLIVVQFSQITFSALHSVRNLYHLRVVELFAEKLVYEFIFFIVLVLVRSLSIILERFDSKQKNEQYFQQYQTIKYFKQYQTITNNLKDQINE